jgi:hypothetical protein
VSRSCFAVLETHCESFLVPPLPSPSEDTSRPLVRMISAMEVVLAVSKTASSSCFEGRLRYPCAPVVGGRRQDARGDEAGKWGSPCPEWKMSNAAGECQCSDLHRSIGTTLTTDDVNECDGPGVSREC